MLRSALAGDGDAVVGAFDAVVDRAGLAGAYGVAWCLAATMVGDATPPGPARSTSPASNRPTTTPAGWPASSARTPTGRADTGEALFGAAMADGLLPDCLLTLAGSTVATLRSRAG